MLWFFCSTRGYILLGPLIQGSKREISKHTEVGGRFPCGSVVKNPFAQVGAAGNKGSVDPWVSKIPWRRKMVIHSSILTRTIPWTEKPDGYSLWGHRVRHCDIFTLHHNLRE